VAPVFCLARPLLHFPAVLLFLAVVADSVSVTCTAPVNIAVIKYCQWMRGVALVAWKMRLLAPCRAGKSAVAHCLLAFALSAYCIV
jgi:hypothetical protein